jgi:hypothetical protein
MRRFTAVLLLLAVCALAATCIVVEAQTPLDIGACYASVGMQRRRTSAADRMHRGRMRCSSHIPPLTVLPLHLARVSPSILPLCARCRFVLHGDGSVTLGANPNIAINGSIGRDGGAETITTTLPWLQYIASDPLFIQCKADKAAAYAAIMAMTCDRTVPAEVGGTTMVPGVTCTVGGTLSMIASTILYFDAGGNQNALFYVRVTGVVGLGASVIFKLQNGALARNIFFGIGGAFTVGATGTYLSGTFISPAAITMGANVFISQGRVLGQAAVVFGTVLNAYLPAGVSCLSQYIATRREMQE